MPLIIAGASPAALAGAPSSPTFISCRSPLDPLMMVTVLWPLGAAAGAAGAADGIEEWIAPGRLAGSYFAMVIGSPPMGSRPKIAKPRNASKNRPHTVAIACGALKGRRKRRLRGAFCPSGALRSSVTTGDPANHRRNPTRRGWDNRVSRQVSGLLDRRPSRIAG